MKNFILISLFMISGQAFCHEYTIPSVVANVATFTTSAPVLSGICIKRVLNDETFDLECKIAAGNSLITTSLLLAKEIIEVRPDAIEYSNSGYASASLRSVVEKIQSEASEQNIVVSFDEIIDSINTLE